MRRRSVGIDASRRSAPSAAPYVAARHEHAVLAVAQQVARSADAVREHERQAARRGLVHDDAPRLVRARGARRRRRRTYASATRSSGSSPVNDRGRRAGRVLERARARAPRRRPARGRPPRRDRAQQHVEALLRRTSRATLRTTTSSSASPSAARSSARRAAELVGALAEARDVDRVREDAYALRRRRRARRRTRGRASPTTSTDAAPRTIGRHDRRLDLPPPAGLRPRVVALDEQHVRNARAPAPGERGLRGERAPAGDDDDVGPRARASAPKIPGVIG